MLKDAIGRPLEKGQRVVVISDDGYNEPRSRNAIVLETKREKGVKIKYDEGQGSVRGSWKFYSNDMVIIDELTELFPELFI